MQSGNGAGLQTLGQTQQQQQLSSANLIGMGASMQHAPRAGLATTPLQISDLMSQPQSLPTPLFNNQPGAAMAQQASALEQMNPQELLQMQAMVAKALQTRNQVPLEPEAFAQPCAVSAPRPMITIEADI